jgi:hypothetical protein
MMIYNVTGYRECKLTNYHDICEKNNVYFTSFHFAVISGYEPSSYKYGDTIVDWYMSFLSEELVGLVFNDIIKISIGHVENNIFQISCETLTDHSRDADYLIELLTNPDEDGHFPIEGFTITGNCLYVDKMKYPDEVYVFKSYGVEAN